MKHQVLTRENIVFVFTALLFIYVIHGVTDAQELKFIEGGTTTREIAEDAAVGTNVGNPLKFSTNSCRRFRLHGRDASSFRLTRVYRGVQLKTSTTFDYETMNSYEVKVTATDRGGSDTIRVTINVIDVNEAPMFSEAMDGGGVNHIQRSVPENTAVGTNIGDPVSAIDPDEAGAVLTYSLNGSNAGMFEIDGGTGQLRTKMLLDYEAFDSEPRGYSVNVHASDGEMSAEIEAHIDVEPVNEFAPMFVEGDAATREIHEKEDVGANVGEPVSATDMDVGDVLEYSLTDIEPDVFEIDSSTGQLRTVTALDYQTKPSYTAKVLVSDGSHVASIAVTIQVLADFVDIPDPNLARVIRRKLGIQGGADITKKAMLELTRLNANRRAPEIDSIDGLEHATNLTELYLDYNSVNDITPLTGLTNLTTLHIEGNRVDRLAALSGLTNLTSLRLSDNWIGYLVPLSGLTNLTELTLESNRIDDITPLSSLTNLRTLSLAHNYRLTDISPLAGLVNLETLKLAYCPIEDFSPLAGLTATLDIDIEGGTAPSVHGHKTDSVLELTVLKTFDRDVLQARLQRLYTENDGSLKYQRAIAVLENLLASMRPDKTVLLANYPNPFNPETWIPYHLAKSADVQITIYNAHGIVVRHLELGYQSAGYYTSTSQAAYWDGCNDFGESVSGGVYFYQLQAGTVSPMRKMVILK